MCFPSESPSETLRIWQITEGYEKHMAALSEPDCRRSDGNMREKVHPGEAFCQNEISVVGQTASLT